jgi:hypothetical protein
MVTDFASPLSCKASDLLNCLLGSSERLMAQKEETQKLPIRFHDLERFDVDWALPRESERFQRRSRASMQELRDFYEAVTPRLKEIVEYLNQYSLDEMPQEALHLLRLSLSLMEVSHAVELWNAPDLSGAFPQERIIIALDGSLAYR